MKACWSPISREPLDSLRVCLQCALMLGLIGCGGNNSRTITAQSIAISFKARAGNTDIRCDVSLPDLGTTKSSATLKDFRFYISDIELITADGRSESVSLEVNEWQASNLALLDFQDRADNCEGESKPTHTQITGTISNSASIQGIRFQVGVPAASNHIDMAKAQAPLTVASLYWSWQGGYKFMRLDVAPSGGITRPSDPDFAATVYNFHLGSTNCSGDPELGESVVCARSNRPVVELNDFDPERDTLVFDYANLVSGLALNSDSKDTPGCMSDKSDTECREFFQQLGLDLTSGSPASGSAQSVFSVE